MIDFLIKETIYGLRHCDIQQCKNINYTEILAQHQH